MLSSPIKWFKSTWDFFLSLSSLILSLFVYSLTHSLYCLMALSPPVGDVVESCTATDPDGVDYTLIADQNTRNYFRISESGQVILQVGQSLLFGYVNKLE